PIGQVCEARDGRPLQVVLQVQTRGRSRAYDHDETTPGPPAVPGVSDFGRSMETRKRGNYDSGDDFVLEYGELRFTFNERDFSERCEQSAMKLGFVGDRLGGTELEDLVILAVNGEIPDPSSALGEHVND